MPGSPAELEQAIAEEDAQTAAARQGGLAGMVPPAREPLDEAAVNALGMTLAQAVPILSSGQVPEVQIAEVEGPVEQLPQDIASPLLTVAAFIQKAGVPGAEKYAFDPQEAMESNQGLAEATRLIGAMASDKAIIQALGGSGGDRQPQEEPVAPTEPVEGEEG